MFGMNFPEIWNLAVSNQILIAGIGTVVAGSAMYLFKSVPMSIYEFLFRQATIEITLNSEYPLFQEILKIMGEHRLRLFSRLYSINHNQEITAGYGRSYAIYRNRLVRFSRTKEDSKNFLIEDLNITIFSRDRKYFDMLVQDAKASNDDMGMLKVYTVDGSHGWGGYNLRAKRDLDTVFIPTKIRNELIGRIDWFRNNREWYDKHGINYKLVILLHGCPGTGKTSIIRALASHFNYRLGAVQSLTDFSGCLRWAPEQSFVVVEDIDTLANLNRGDEQSKKKPSFRTGNRKIGGKNVLVKTPLVIEDEEDEKTTAAVAAHNPLAEMMKSMDKTIHHMLNTLDGLNTPDGSIIFLTTNHLEKLDPALIRPGRIDYCVEIGPLEYDDMSLMFKSFYGTKPFIKQDAYVPMVGAELQEIFMRHTAVQAEQLLVGGSDGGLPQPLALQNKRVRRKRNS